MNSYTILPRISISIRLQAWRPVPKPSRQGNLGTQSLGRIHYLVDPQSFTFNTHGTGSSVRIQFWLDAESSVVLLDWM